MEKSSLNLDHLPSDKEVSCYALFYVDHDGSIMFDMAWGEQDKDIIDLIQLLYSIRNTKIVDNGLDSALQNSTSPEDMYGVYAIIQGLKKMEDAIDEEYKESTKEKPLIKPSDNK